MSFYMLPANFLVLQKQLMLGVKLMSSVSKKCCGVRWTESDEWDHINSIFNLACMGEVAYC